jgi:nucleoside-diphosphate-sugar epimerase
MNILLTGSAGGIGSTLGYFLFKNGNDLDLLDNFRNGYRENLIIDGKTFGNFFDIDVSNFSDLDSLSKTYDCIIHLAAVTSLPDCESNIKDTLNINVLGTANILEYARKWNIPHVIFASTSAVYENNKEDIFTEDLKIYPRLWYSLSKKMSEELCESYRQNYNMNITTIRLFNVFGPRQDIYRKNPPLLNYLVKQIKTGNRPILHSNGEQSRDYIHVDDVVNFINICLYKKPNDTFNVCTGELLSVNQIVDCVLDVFGSDIVPYFAESGKLWNSYPNLFEGNYPLDRNIVSNEVNKYSKGSYQKAKNILGWTPNTNTKEMIKKVTLQINLK